MGKFESEGIMVVFCILFFCFFLQFVLYFVGPRHWNFKNGNVLKYHIFSAVNERS